MIKPNLNIYLTYVLFRVEKTPQHHQKKDQVKNMIHLIHSENLTTN